MPRYRAQSQSFVDQLAVQELVELPTANTERRLYPAPPCGVAPLGAVNVDTRCGHEVDGLGEGAPG